jgi:hypothetical protein
MNQRRSSPTGASDQIAQGLQEGVARVHGLGGIEHADLQVDEDESRGVRQTRISQDRPDQRTGHGSAA